jgi:hypothetical protein
VREVRAGEEQVNGEIGQWRIRDSTVFLWVDNFTCGHARAHHFIYTLQSTCTSPITLHYITLH